MTRMAGQNQSMNPFWTAEDFCSERKLQAKEEERYYV